MIKVISNIHLDLKGSDQTKSSPAFSHKKNTQKTFLDAKLSDSTSKYLLTHNIGNILLQIILTATELNVRAYTGRSMKLRYD